MHTTGAHGLAHTQPMMGKALVMILMLTDPDPDQLLIHVANRREIHLFAQFKAAFNNHLGLNLSKSMQIQPNTLGMNKFWTADQARSEEHTSELQSRENLVCRLLLEKKKNR